MGRVFKKKVGSKREADVEEKEEIVTKKKAKKEETPEPEEEVDDEDVSDEEGEDVEDEEEDVDDEEGEEGDGEQQDFDFEAYPPAENDRDGIVNILTQTFLRTDIDLKAMSEQIIENAPKGIVITQPYEEDEETEEDFMVYALATTLVLNETAKDDAPKYIKDIFAYLLNRAKKGAPKEIYKQLVDIQEAGDGETALFISDRLLNFPANIVPPMFECIREELKEKKYKTYLYISKLRVEESDGSAAESSSAGGSGGKKKKKGKAEKKRAAAAALEQAETEFDNSEDLLLFSLTKGKEVHFDIPVHMDVEPGSKFHIVEKDGKKWNPYRRLTIMDADRLDAFLEKAQTIAL